MFGLSKLYAYGILGVLIVSIVGGGYLYVASINKKNVKLTVENSKLTTRAETAEGAITKLTESIVLAEERQKKLNGEISEAREQVKTLSKLFTDHDFAKLLKAKPGLITTRMIKGTAKLFSDLEGVSK